MAELDQVVWINKNCFYCPKLKLKLTPERCAFNRTCVTIEELDIARGKCRVERPYFCRSCNNWELLTKRVGHAERDEHHYKDKEKIVFHDSPKSKIPIVKANNIKVTEDIERKTIRYIICLRCKDNKKHASRGLCALCYQIEHYHGNLEKYPKIKRLKKTKSLPKKEEPDGDNNYLIKLNNNNISIVNTISLAHNINTSDVINRMIDKYYQMREVLKW